MRLRAPLPIAAVATIAALSGCGVQSAASTGGRSASRPAAARSSGTHHGDSTQATTTSSTAGDRLPQIAVLGNPARAPARWRPAVSVGGATAVWAAQRPGVSLLRFDQSLVRLRLHAGIGEPAGSGWAGGSSISRAESAKVLAGFNGGFRLNLPAVGFLLRGRVGVPLHAGLASIVTYTEGRTNIGSWRRQVPAAGHEIHSVLQNLQLMIDEGAAAPTLSSCVQECWGSTLGGGAAVARSGLGIRADGELVWAGGESLTPAQLAQALLAAGARRAIQLDINPEWVASYLYVHDPGRLTPLQVLPNQPGIPGQLLSPYNRDFFTVVAR